MKMRAFKSISKYIKDYAIILNNRNVKNIGIAAV